MEDLHAVLDAAGSERPALLGISEGGPMSILFAGTYPERVASLMLYGSFPTQTGTAFSPGSRRERRQELRGADRSSSTGARAWRSSGSLPALRAARRLRRTWGRFERAAASPGMVACAAQYYSEIDVRHVLPALRVPTLVLHRAGDRLSPVRGRRATWPSRSPARASSSSPGDDHIPCVGDADALLDEVEEFLTGSRTRAEPERALATVLFTDIVGSTERAAALGDRRWRDLLERHHALVRDAARAPTAGARSKTIGDGFLATFDGPARAIRCAWRSPSARRRLGSRSAPACTPASAS